jgi:hypothetical protein
VGGHDDHARVRLYLAQAAERGETVDTRHPDIEEDHVERLGLERLDRGGAVFDGQDVVARLAQALLQDPA